jgi:nondiscriminating glutamyl-tRNA synthetase
MTIKTRFAPSPTGEVHFGNVRTALFNVLAAISQNGSFLLRIEDTDEERSSKEYEALLYKDLKWLGVHWDEGADLEQEYGNHGPYRQSQRKHIYDHYYDKLLAENKAYYCFCTEAQLALSRKLQRSQGLPPKYHGTCANLSKEEIEAKLARGEMPTVRFRVDRDKEIKFHDIVKGEQIFKGSDIGDFIIRRASGTASFMFCNAIDDSLMGVTVALRGEDHLTNTPRQLLILESLGLKAPKYGHISLITGSDGSPLSKRHGSRSVKSLREEGFLPEAIVNYLARLGHQYGDLGYSSLDDLGHKFQFSNLVTSAARYDEKHLLFWQKEAVLNISLERFKQWLGDVLFLCPTVKRDGFALLMKNNITFPSEVVNWARILFTDDVTYTQQQIDIMQEAGPEFFELIKKYAQENQDKLDYAKLLDILKDKTGLKGKKLFMPLRVSITQSEHGPELVNILELMGSEQLVKRMEKVLGNQAESQQVNRV